MNRFLLILISCLCLTTTISAQSNKLIKELESKTVVPCNNRLRRLSHC